MGYRTGVLRQQTVPGAARPPGVERAERGAGAPDGVVRGDTDGAVVCGRWPCRCAAGKGPPLVCPSGGADVQRYAGGAAAPDVAVPRLRAFGCRGALAGMRRNATPDAFRSGVEVRKTSRTVEINYLFGNPRHSHVMTPLSRNENDLFCELRRNEAEQLPLPIFTMLFSLMSNLSTTPQRKGSELTIRRHGDDS